MAKNLKSKFKIDLKKYLKGKTIAFIDYANIKAWAREKNLAFDLEVLYQYLKNLGVEKIIFYYGTDPKNPRSHAFLTKMRQIGFEVVTKEVKYYKINLLNLLKTHPNWEFLKQLNSDTQKLLFKEVKKLEKDGLRLYLPKANFDVEMALDLLLFKNVFDIFVIFSGDSDLFAVVKFLKSKGKKVIIISGKKYLSGELASTANQFIFLDELYYKIRGLFVTYKKPRPRKSGSGRKVIIL